MHILIPIILFVSILIVTDLLGRMGVNQIVKNRGSRS
jgi:hypothetical protein